MTEGGHDNAARDADVGDGSMGTEALDDARLAVRVQAGDAGAFDALVRRYVRPALTVAHRILGEPADAEDAVQEAFLAALRHIGSFDSRRPFAPWFLRIVATRALNLRAARARRRGDALDDDIASSASGPAHLAELADLSQRMQVALAGLTGRQRMVVQLVELDGFTTGEVADMLGTSPATVRWHLHVARQALKALLMPLVPDIR